MIRDRGSLKVLGALLLLLLLRGNAAEMEATTDAGLGEKEPSRIVAQHNRLRSRVNPMAANMQKMEWNEELASLARRRAASCRPDAPGPGPGPAPAPPPPPPYHHAGWNTHVSAHGATSFSEVVQRWFEEGRHYSHQGGRCGANATCQRYKQLVWATSAQLGCARHVCVSERDWSWDFYVCSYSPGGNWEVNGRALPPYRAGESCSLCVSSMSGCFRLWDHAGGLCEVPKNPCRMSCGDHGRLNVSSCRCRCDPGFTGVFCQVRCSVLCVHGGYQKEECSCRCDLGYGGPRCAEKLQFPLSSCGVRVDGDCFAVSPGAHTYYAAKSRCQGRGGMLAQIHNQKVQDSLVFYLEQLESSSSSSSSNDVAVAHSDFETRNFWIGLTYKSPKDSFRWDSGEPLGFSSFAFGQPDNLGFGNCVELQVSSGFNWNDQRCRTRNRYICQYAPHHVALWNIGGG